MCRFKLFVEDTCLFELTDSYGFPLAGEMFARRLLGANYSLQSSRVAGRFDQRWISTAPTVATPKRKTTAAAATPKPKPAAKKKTAKRTAAAASAVESDGDESDGLADQFDRAPVSDAEELKRYEKAAAAAVKAGGAAAKYGAGSEKWVGAHISAAGGLVNAVPNALSIGARAFAFDLRSKRQWAVSPLSDLSCAAFKRICSDHGYTSAQILPHGSYLMNLGSHSDELLKRSRAVFIEELKRCNRLGIDAYNFHPGSACNGGTVEEAIERIAESINQAHVAVPRVVTVIENMAGQGSVIGGPLQQIASIIDKVKDKSRVGVCIDTCHAFAYGYDLSSKAAVDRLLSEFDRLIGLKFLRGMHLNDSKEAFGSRKDRHANIGKGEIALDGFRAIMNDPRLNRIPMILETPQYVLTGCVRDRDRLIWSHLFCLFVVRAALPKTRF